MFIISNPDLVIAQCLGGIVGSFPALNARPKEELEDVDRAGSRRRSRRPRPTIPPAIVAPFAVNQIVHKSNDRLAHDMEVCVRHEVPIIITSLQAPGDVVEHVHGYGGLVFHDVTNLRHAEKALQAGVDGLILVCAGAGGHAGTMSPFALVGEVRRIYDGTIILAGAITNGAAVLAAQAMGADLAYMGTRFIATEEAHAAENYKRMIVEAGASEIVYTSLFTGVAGNYLKRSVAAAGLDPDDLPSRRQDPDELRLDAGEAVEGRLGRRPGGRNDRRHPPGRAGDRPAEGRIRRRANAARRLTENRK